MPKNDDTKTGWLRNSQLAAYMHVTPMTINRWQRNPDLNFPAPSIISGVPYTKVEAVDAWMLSRVVTRTRKVA